jgi:hypothetical protein
MNDRASATRVMANKCKIWFEGRHNPAQPLFVDPLAIKFRHSLSIATDSFANAGSNGLPIIPRSGGASDLRFAAH